MGYEVYTSNKTSQKVRIPVYGLRWVYCANTNKEMVVFEDMNKDLYVMYFEEFYKEYRKDKK